jgi:uncharacterized protein DUF6883
MRLPHGEHAVVPIEKLIDYCLNGEHPRGRHKARVFESLLGITAANAEALRTAILEAALANDAIPTEVDDYGQRFVLDFEMKGLMSVLTVRSLWIVRRGEEVPRLTSCFVR